MIRALLAAVLTASAVLAGPASADPFWRAAQGGDRNLPPEMLAPAPAVPDEPCAAELWLGLWETEFGPLEILAIEEGEVTGRYEYLNGNIAGTLDETGCVLTGRWDQEPSHSDPQDVGPLRFVFDPADGGWSGTWQFDADPVYVGRWSGTRVPDTEP